MSKMAKLPKRNEISDEFKWRLEDMISSKEEWEIMYKEIMSMTEEITSYSGKLKESENILLDCLKKRDQLEEKLSRLYVYSNMKLHEDANNSEAQNTAEKANSLMVKVNSSISFIEPEISSMSDDLLKSYMDSSDGLKLYKTYFDDLLRKKEHILSMEEELLLARAQELAGTPENTFAMFNNADLKFPTIKDEDGNDVELTKGRYVTFMESTNRRVRKDAFEALYGTYRKYKNTLAATYNANIKKDIFYMQARKFNSTCEASLFENNIPVAVYDQLIETVHKYLPLMHRYVSIRKRMLNLDKLHMYDVYTPIVKDIDIKVTFEEAKEKVLEALAPLGEEYCDLLRKGFNEKWIDVYENEGKRSGAYSWGTYGVHPYVLLNHQDDVNHMFTLAHEMGHSLHTYYSSKTQPFIYAEYPTFLAEVASTVNEALLMEYLLKTTEDKNQRLYLINYFMEQFKGTLYRQAMFAEFERTTHELVEQGEALTADTLSSMYHDINVKYFGEDMIIDSEVDMEWARIPHFYYNYYVFQYSTGYSAAIALSQKLLKEGEEAVTKYKNFLKSGSSEYPIDTLKKAGVDMTTAEPIEKALKVFEGLLDEMESIIE
ncbi:oligoendopeptidase F [Vallitalea sp.]|jgi:oligoendopeptidase F|uniref:oligoendopeptidase F n=1 Tax=Vallitalea sp. TaxID=1882829 RepID=UPI0025FCDE5D|nr:oligoendopeptidase F [Vallitalea sp.]MCT4685769.1 oligoendopeptidase F [Vallitalea sp.]